MIRSMYYLVCWEKDRFMYLINFWNWYRRKLCEVLKNVNKFILIRVIVCNKKSWNRIYGKNNNNINYKFIYMWV